MRNGRIAVAEHFTGQIPFLLLNKQSQSIEGLVLQNATEKSCHQSEDNQHTTTISKTLPVQN